ncbi:Crp/Fnr family transcriptional regulator [Algoriphagus sp. CAU 1675]|uniref:Crp/Fnr family transcriptional regulator n=1 Tax=Algoriphagus sp. CAU 1675 TaxID=3032597 RepID=UPI0023DA5AF7|nr:Crp/Fnr family transcriptional regulator [Algoriphagus sp. CAU 1675]MDF2157324.1 Crp/Fnr family transcriptional regulator [Algoriphagus sp. CAU 1675]
MIDSKTEIRNLLNYQFPDFQGELAAEIVESGEIVDITADTLMMEIGQKVEKIPLIVSGLVKVFRESEDDHDHELFMYYLGPGEACAVTLICSAKEGYSKIKAIAEEDTSLIIVPVTKFEEWMAKYPSWFYFVMDTYQHRFDELLKVVDSIAFHRMDERLLEYLEKSAEVSHSSIVHKTHQQIAQELNTSREVITRLLKKLELKGMLTVNRHQIKLLQ